MPKNFKTLFAALPAEDQAEVKERVRKTREKMALHEVRRARKLSQTQVALELGVAQGEVSKIENRTDMHLSTLQNYVEALGGRLKMQAVFPESIVSIELALKS